MPFLHVALVLQLCCCTMARTWSGSVCVLPEHFPLPPPLLHPYNFSIATYPFTHKNVWGVQACTHTQTHTYTPMLVQEVVCKQVLRTTMLHNNPTWNKPAVCFILGWALLIWVIYFNDKTPPRNLKEYPAPTCRVSCTHTCAHTQFYTVFYIYKKTNLSFSLANI